ncbi:alkaline ceramidase 3 isoform X3 [Phyllopteryx taeniolatus]|uniref:alkaline ceramidase 3 isoform X3 n=1 Tax=Phyllopteryx taeniolatus TaxID=161469 RepID=UPI002AD23BB8|nr:alkaline ceramidase 3 isoform X3 [Phyllopteryx taeniolatus]
MCQFLIGPHSPVHSYNFCDNIVHKSVREKTEEFLKACHIKAYKYRGSSVYHGKKRFGHDTCCRYECFKQGNSISWFPVALLFIFSITVTVVYLQWKEPVFHQVMYGALVACLVMRSVFIVTWVYPWLRPLCYTSLGVFMLGFLLWNIDNIFCDSLRASRQTLPPGVGVVTQFHAWWHIFTGLGSYLHILLSLQIRTTYLKYRPKVKFLCGVWPTLHLEPQKTS